MPDAGRRTIVIGIGNPQRGDDAAGLATAKWLRGTLPRDVEVIEHDGEATSLLARLEGVATAYLIDACTSTAAAGEVHRFDVGSAPLPAAAFTVSTHGLGLAQAIALARVLGQLPGRCIVYAIGGASFEPGAPLSPPVAAAIPEAARRVQQEVMGAPRPQPPFTTASGIS